MHSVDLCAVRVPPEGAAQHHWLLLDPAEQARAQRFHRAADRHRFVVARATLRACLGVQLGIDAAALRFVTDRWGKPALAHHAAPHFNSSHSGEWVLHAFSASAAVGVDVEALVRDPLPLVAARDLWSAGERAWLLAQPPDALSRCFTDLWVRKEAWAKALGQGLAASLAEMDTLADPRIDTDGGPSWVPLALGEGYAACVAYLGPRPRLQAADCGVCIRTLQCIAS